MRWVLVEVEGGMYFRWLGERAMDRGLWTLRGNEERGEERGDREGFLGPGFGRLGPWIFEPICGNGMRDLSQIENTLVDGNLA